MSVVGKIDDLIEAGWGVVESDYDPVAFHHWRRSAYECLISMVGPDHVYTRHFEELVRQGGKTDLLAAGGLLSAVREQASSLTGCHRSEPVAMTRSMSKS
ncbi:MAG: hypothetical protein QG577_1745 [Thermodesulfobacteriota bacterium]|nr:hypothetical protein [Thermodesulfobacteriota bacterium]